MSGRLHTILALSFAMAASVVAADRSAASTTVYRGICDASAAVAIDADRFVVANDDKNILMAYRVGQPKGEEALDLRDYLKDKNSDLEGAARIGDRIFWIASHGRKANGEFKPERRRFFATPVTGGAPSKVEIPPLPPVENLLDQMIADERYKALGLEAASQKPSESRDGLNIEGLAATPDGKLLIGFRNPRLAGLAIVAVLENPAETIQGKPARFGAPWRLALGGRGIRSIERIGDRYLIIAGPHDDGANDGSDFRLYAAPSVGDQPAALDNVSFRGLFPEAIFAMPDGSIHILSDDGGVMVDGERCKDADKAKRSFRGQKLDLPASPK